jgi:hypothetical protein
MTAQPYKAAYTGSPTGVIGHTQGDVLGEIPALLVMFLQLSSAIGPLWRCQIVQYGRFER